MLKEIANQMSKVSDSVFAVFPELDVTSQALPESSGSS
jgi:hypothetical protein